MTSSRHLVHDLAQRIIDALVAGVALIVLSPVLAVVAVLVRRNLGSPVLFVQERPGKDGRIFRLYKFRTMRDAVGRDGAVLSDEERLTPFGARLRSTSLDELPEFINVLKGDMSLVGPRPLLPEYLPLYTENQARRHEVRPGITGLAQVSGRNALSWEERFEYDVEYVENRSLSLDARVLWDTVATVLRREGVSEAGHATMSPFRGSPPADGSGSGDDR